MRKADELISHSLGSRSRVDQRVIQHLERYADAERALKALDTKEKAAINKRHAGLTQKL